MCQCHLTRVGTSKHTEVKRSFPLCYGLLIIPNLGRKLDLFFTHHTKLHYTTAEADEAELLAAALQEDEEEDTSVTAI